jgi:protein involved in polysaccharide export with SLBB domain
MIEQLRKSASHWVVALGVVLVALLSGCGTTPPPKFADPQAEMGNMFHTGDMVFVTALAPSGEKIFDHNERIGEDGKISLLYIGSVTAEGKTPSELQNEIRTNYVPRLYKELNVTVHGEQRYFYVDGEVRIPGQKEYPGTMSVVKAISVAGGFTEFAKHSKVQLTHNGKTQIINVDKAIKDPRYDVSVYPGDRINVPRRIL